MGRSLTSSMTITAAILLLTACGGGSGASTTNAGITNDAGSVGNTIATVGTSTPSKVSGGNAHPLPSTGRRRISAGNEVVSAVHGDFRTIIPKGYKNGPTTSTAETGEVEYTAVGPKVDGFGASVTIFRAAAGNSDLAAVTSRALSQLSKRPAFLPKLHRLSSQQALRVDGEPAIAVDYVLAGRKTSERRQIFVVHGGWAYEISDEAAPSRYAASLRALGELLRGWRWQ